MTNLDNPYGYTVFYGSATINTKIPQLLADMQMQGATWLRYQVPWSDIDVSANGVYTPGGPGTNLILAGLDKAVQLCNAAGINILFNIQYPPGNPATGTGYYTQLVAGSSPATYLPSASMTAAFALFLATRYNGGANGTLNALDIGNEDYDLAGNAQQVRDAGGTYLANSLVALYANCKAANPAMTIISGALLNQSVSHIQTWLTGLYQGGGLACCDALNYHFYKSGGTYPVGTDPEGGNVGFSLFWRTIRDTVAGFGLAKPIWVTECGYGTDVVDAFHQWQYLQKVFTAAMKSGIVEKVFHFTIGNNDVKSLTQHGTVDGLPETYQPAFYIMQTFIQQYPVWNTPPPKMLTCTAPGVNALTVSAPGQNPLTVSAQIPSLNMTEAS